MSPVSGAPLALCVQFFYFSCSIPPHGLIGHVLHGFPPGRVIISRTNSPVCCTHLWGQTLGQNIPKSGVTLLCEIASIQMWSLLHHVKVANWCSMSCFPSVQVPERELATAMSKSNVSWAQTAGLKCVQFWSLDIWGCCCRKQGAVSRASSAKECRKQPLQIHLMDALCMERFTNNFTSCASGGMTLGLNVPSIWSHTGPVCA